MREATARLVAAAVPGDLADLNVTRLAGGEVTLEALRFACEAVPFLADRRAVVVDGLFARLASRRGRSTSGDATREAISAAPMDGAAVVPAGGPAAKRNERESRLGTEIGAYLPQIPPPTLVVFVEREAPPKAGPLAKGLGEAKARITGFEELRGSELLRWIVERAKQGGAKLSDRAAGALVRFVGGDLRAQSLEIAKLAAYAGPGRTVELDDVLQLVHQNNEANVLELVDAVGQGNTRRAMRALRVLLDQGERPERILAMIARQVRLLLQVKDAVERGQRADSLGPTLGLAPFPLGKLLEQVPRLTLRRLEAMHRRVLHTDLAIKTGLQEPALALELLAFELAGATRRR